jgi:acyl-CoA oxidase
MGGDPKNVVVDGNDENERNAEWRKNFTTFVRNNLPSSSSSYSQSSLALRELISNPRVGLHFQDIQNNPNKFFDAHELLARRSPELGPGFWIRFTVHFNLFAGTVVALGSREHFEVLERASEKGEIGCFALTEKYAGVNSGLVVETTAEYDEKAKEFVFSSSSGFGAKKNWISQGLVAEWAVIVARLVMYGKDMGPHAFLCRVREEGTKEVKRGIIFGDMGKKTIGNDLDNAWIEFDGFRCGRGCLLNRYADVQETNGAYVRKGGDVNQMSAIGQRLFTGRIAVAKAALTFCEEVFEHTKRYSDAKLCAMRGTNKTLSHVPQLKALYEEAENRLKKVDAFVTFCKKRLSQVLKVRETPSVELQTAIAVCKIRAVETAIELTFRLKQEVGSYALMDEASFKNSDFLQCCKFAEGDSRILSQKLARDAFSGFLKQNSARSIREASICESIRRQIQKYKEDRGGTYNKIDAWDSCWEDVYELANAICDRVMRENDFEEADEHGENGNKSGNFTKSNPSLVSRL